jgi:hypothetical protein
VVAEIALEPVCLAFKLGHVLGEFVELLAILLDIAFHRPLKHPGAFFYLVGVVFELFERRLVEKIKE